MTRNQLGRLVRDTWITWARQQPDPKPTWLVPYDDLPEPDKEADRMIGEAVAEAATIELREHTNRFVDVLQGRRIELAERKSRGELSKEEASEFAQLQTAFFAYLGYRFPKDERDTQRFEELAKELESRK